MRSVQRLKGLKNWLYENLCQGRVLKTPPQNHNVGQILTAEPQCFLGWAPTRADETGRNGENPINTCPSITIMPNLSKGKAMEEKRFDRYNNVSRPEKLGQTLAVSILFSVYEPGIRLPGYMNDGKCDMTKIEEGTEQGLFTLLNWMDDCLEHLLAAQSIPETDLFLNEESLCYSLYTDQNYVIDKRPIFYGFVNCEFNCYANEKNNSTIENYLK